MRNNRQHKRPSWSEEKKVMIVAIKRSNVALYYITTFSVHLQIYFFRHENKHVDFISSFMPKFCMYMQIKSNKQIHKCYTTLK